MLLDCQGLLTESSSFNTTTMDVTLQAAIDLIQQSIQTSAIYKTGKRDAIGILLYNTRFRSSQSCCMDYASTTNVHALVPLEPPGVPTILALRKYTGSALAQDYGLQAQGDNDNTATVEPFLTGLEEAAKLFSDAKCVHEGDARHVWIFTNSTNANKNKDRLTKLKNKFATFRESGMNIVVWELKQEEPQPEMKNENDIQDESLWNAMGVETVSTHSTELLLQRMRNTWKKTRRSFAAPLLLAPTTAAELSTQPEQMWLDFFKPVMRAKRPNQVRIHQESGKYVF
jgi:hypothetical protein